MTTLAMSAAGAIVPFFLHNVFGQNTKMFIGDGGTLVIGTMMAMFVMNILGTNSGCSILAAKGVGLIPFTLAVLSIPVFDTLRVMSTRILNKKSPFHPDKTHLHHMFIDLGFSHIGTTISILSLNFLIVAAWFISYKMGASIEKQMNIVVAMGFLSTFGFYGYAKRLLEKNSNTLNFFKRIAKALHVEKKGIWYTIQRIIDKL